MKAANCGYQGKIGAARAGYLALALDRALDRALARALDRALARALDLALARDLDRDIQDGLGLDIHLVNLLFLGALLERWADSTTGIGREAVLPLVLQAGELLAAVRAGSESLEDSELARALAELPFPAEDAPGTAWGEFARRLQTVLRQNRNLRLEWDLSWEDYNQLDAYLRANRLLVECLQLAVVTDRQAIEDRLLLPPAKGGRTMETAWLTTDIID